MDLPRLETLKRDLSAMGLVYAVVLVLLGPAMGLRLPADQPPQPPPAPQTDVIGGPAGAPR
ncbi:MAG: hypothetical protein ABIL09_16155 [Gemmatimonadota bacterium]